MTREMTDQEFLEAFERLDIAKKDFHHGDHLRLAWACLRHASESDALARVRAAIRRFAEKHGVPQLYHETITRFWSPRSPRRCGRPRRPRTSPLSPRTAPTSSTRAWSDAATGPRPSRASARRRPGWSPMPEGDTIRRAARALHGALAGRVVTGLLSPLPPVTAAARRLAVVGRRVDSVEARGKHLLVRFE